LIINAFGKFIQDKLIIAGTVAFATTSTSSANSHLRYFNGISGVLEGTAPIRTYSGHLATSLE
jgi:hypothetical protein